jgi:hypothetical protein
VACRGSPKKRTWAMQNDSSSTNSGPRRDRSVHVPLVRDRSFGQVHTGRYVLTEEGRAGGMARIYSAEDPALARSVAVKLPHVPEDGGVGQFSKEGYEQ